MTVSAVHSNANALEIVNLGAHAGFFKVKQQIPRILDRLALA
jgi:hypothetical protein